MMLLFVFVAVLLTWIYLSTRKPKNFPPGPPRLPMIGSLPFMTGSGSKPSLLHGVIDQVKKHGPIVGFYFGKTPAVILADYKLIKEGYKLEQLASRPESRPFNELRPGWEKMTGENAGRFPGVIFTNGHYWKELRRFMLRNLRDFGFGKSSMEELFHDEIAKLCQMLSKTLDQPVDLLCTMNVSIINALWAIMVGERLDLEDPNLAKVVELVDRLLHEASPVSPVVAALPIPSMAKWPIIRQLAKYDLAGEAQNCILKIIEPIIESHLQTLDQDNVRDFMDVMLLEIESTRDPNSPFEPKVGLATIKNSLIDLFLAGMETTSSSLIHIFLQLLHHPEIQEKVHQEIDAVVGKHRLPSLSDRDNMPYVNACLLESLRNSCLAFVGVPHMANADVQLGGYTIPKGATVMSSLWHVLHNPEYFKNPEVFNPDRFIDSNGKFVNDERMIAFGIGKRSCLGQTLAEKEFFIFFTGIMQQFDILSVPGVTLPSYQEIYPEAILRTAPVYKVILKKRL